MRFLTLLIVTAALALQASLVNAAGSPGPTFTYQGRLIDGAAPANGRYDFRFSLHTAAVNGQQIGSSVIVEDLPVASGVFTATVDFGAAFDGASRWIEVAVRAGVSADDFTALTPR